MNLKRILLLAASALLVLPYRAAADIPIESELFPPDFLLREREALGLSETQAQEIQKIVEDVQPRFESLKGQLEDKAKAFRDVLHQPQPEVAQAQEKLRAMLGQENEMKLLQVTLMLTLRNKLTAEQVEKARQLRAQEPRANTAGKDPREGLPERLGKKFEQLRAAIEKRAAGGVPPDDLMPRVREIQTMAQGGRPLEAEQRIDQLLSELSEKKP
jgi:Spy/CpxP family protein refolding chaperone